MEDPNILDSTNFLDIETILENRSTRDSLLRVVPPDILTPSDIQLMENESYRHNMTTARWLLFLLGRKGICVSEFVQWLEKAKLEKALMVLKKDVPLKIIEQSATIVNVPKGTKLSLICKATSFPSPEYQWLKEGDEGLKELILQQDEELIIDNVKEEDSGFYCCLVTKTNLDPNSGINYLYSYPIEVVVLEESPQNPHIYLQDSSIPSKLTTDLTFNKENNFESQSLYKAKIKCRVHPPRITVAQGTSIILHCRTEYIDAESKLTDCPLPIYYQWHKNGRPIEGATSPNLALTYLYPDVVTKAKIAEYVCYAYNKFDDKLFDYEFSNSAVVKIKDETEKTIHFATEKCALLFANDTYHKFEHFQPLKTPAQDVSDLAKILKEKMNFKTFVYINLNLEDMKRALNDFCANLQPASYVVFYFAGHGFEFLGQTYLLPVDCCEDYDPKGAITTESVLECLQKTKPALNVLLVDCCRNLPPQFRRNSKRKSLEDEKSKLFENYEMFQAKMGHNTVIGYSTPFLYPSFECRSKENSFFAEFLKKYIAEDKSILEIFCKIQLDFKADELVEGRQCPEIRSTLAGNRKLCDEIQGTSDQLSNLKVMRNFKTDELVEGIQHPEIRSTLAGNLKLFDEIQGTSEQLSNLKESLLRLPVMPFEFPVIESTITIQAIHSINHIEISVSIFISEKSPMELLNELEINIVSNMQEIQLLEDTGVHLKDLDKKVEASNFLLKKQAFGIQKLQGKMLDCQLLIKSPRVSRAIKPDFKIDVKNIFDLKPSVNDLGTLAIGRNSP